MKWALLGIGKWLFYGISFFCSQVEYCRFQRVYVLLYLCPLQSPSLAAQLRFSFLFSSGLGLHSCEKQIKMEICSLLSCYSIKVTAAMDEGPAIGSSGFCALTGTFYVYSHSTLTLLQLVNGYRKVLSTPSHTGAVLGSGHPQLPEAPHLAQVHCFHNNYIILICLYRTWRERHMSPVTEQWGKTETNLSTGVVLRSAIGSSGLDRSLKYLLQDWERHAADQVFTRFPGDLFIHWMWKTLVTISFDIIPKIIYMHVEMACSLPFLQFRWCLDCAQQHPSESRYIRY